MRTEATGDRFEVPEPPQAPRAPEAVLAPPNLSGKQYEVGQGVLSIDRGLVGAPASTAEREAILDSLYDARRVLTRAKRLETFSSRDQERLSELNSYIDEWEASEVVASEPEELWEKVNKLAESVLKVQARVERNR